MLLLKSSASERSVDSAPHPRAGFLPQPDKPAFTFIAHQGFHTQILAHMLDSLVRVTRRASENHFVRIANTPSGIRHQAVQRRSNPHNYCPSPMTPHAQQPPSPCGRVLSFLSRHRGTARRAITGSDSEKTGRFPTFPTAISRDAN